MRLRRDWSLPGVWYMWPVITKSVAFSKMWSRTKM